jgi:hypothetical protein
LTPKQTSELFNARDGYCHRDIHHCCHHGDFHHLNAIRFVGSCAPLLVEHTAHLMALAHQ